MMLFTLSFIYFEKKKIFQNRYIQLIAMVCLAVIVLAVLLGYILLFK